MSRPDPSFMQPIQSGSIFFKNRILRSATYEGLCDKDGLPLPGYYDLYTKLAATGVGGIITGFMYTEKEGRAMQPGQAGIDTDDKILNYRRLTTKVHEYGCPIFAQLAHCGRQSRAVTTGQALRGASGSSSLYFRERPVPLSTEEVYARADAFGRAAWRTKEAGFDGIQIHAAHGYLIHQFLLSSVNKRHDEFGIDKETGIGSRFLQEVIETVRHHCGRDYPILIKISGAATSHEAFGPRQFEALIRFLDIQKLSAIEISYGTMDHPLNIFRGDFPTDLILRWNPILKGGGWLRRLFHKTFIRYYYLPKQLSFSHTYNLAYAAAAKKITTTPIISVGGFRSGAEIEAALDQGRCDLVSLSRPFIAEPDFMTLLKADHSHTSACCNCNYCAVLCDSGRATRCYSPKKNNDGNH